MTHDIDASLVFFLGFFAGLGGLIALLYFLEDSLPGQKAARERRRS